MPFNSIFAWMMKKRIHQIDLFRKYPHEVQKEVFERLIQCGTQTEFGKTHGFNTVHNYTDFQKVPLQSYEDTQPWIDRAMNGDQGVLWPTDTKWFAQSSGTTSDRSKLIPVTKESLEDCHYKGGKDLLAMYYNNHPNRKLYNGKHLIIGGSAQINHLSADSYFGDLSAIIVKNLPWWAEIRRTPSREIALMSEWQEKIERMAESTIKQDVYIIAGVPSWTMVLANKVLEISGKSNLKEVWPNLELFMHGGVSFEPYREQFKRLIPDPKMNYVETYNASEGFFGIQDQVNSDEMLLMLDYGIFFEFIPMSSFDGVNSKAVLSIEGVNLDENYAVVISTNGGLWRYILGDTIRFTSRAPYRFKITGRTKSFINCFGEELIVENTELAIAEACEKTGAQIKEYSVCPIFMDKGARGAHEWAIEFVKTPKEIERFALILDEDLRELNSDYDAKRYHNMVLDKPVIHEVPHGTFDGWLKSINKLGGQNKVPRLSNDRVVLEQILQIASTQ
ncbi:MAG: GH3 auxin-responsive promoter family protein [Crocinitomicaceae bacterium]|nr:GH3 auxin-responsive promoter family protein [Crocinitomicaceae bacterium]MDG1776541.1 GH3 auxin-responsive promoter family protein [Crocinitomicaceae bacterium]